MNVYVYQAALLCEDCGDSVCRSLQAQGEEPEDTEDEHSYDSDDYPKGPYPDGGGESDCPEHCDHCGAFLANALTSDGLAYTREAIETARQAGRTECPALTIWAPFYNEEESI